MILISLRRRSLGLLYVIPCGYILRLHRLASVVVHTVIFLTNEIKDKSELNLIKGLVQHPIDSMDLNGRKKEIELAFDHYGMKHQRKLLTSY